MNRPNIKVTEPQKEIESREITGPEADAILKKYGYSTQHNIINYKPEEPQCNLSFEEMVRQNEEKLRIEEEKRRQRMSGVKPITYSADSYDSKTSYTSDGDFGFKIEITSNMKLPE